MRFDSKGYKDQMIKQSNCDCRIVWNHTIWYEITLWISSNWQKYLSKWTNVMPKLQKGWDLPDKTVAALHQECPVEWWGEVWAMRLLVSVASNMLTPPASHHQGHWPWNLQCHCQCQHGGWQEKNGAWLLIVDGFKLGWQLATQRRLGTDILSRSTMLAASFGRFHSSTSASQILSIGHSPKVRPITCVSEHLIVSIFLV